MSHIDVTPPSLSIVSETEIFSSPQLVAEPRSSGSFVRGLVCGLVLGLSFWTFVAVELFGR